MKLKLLLVLALLAVAHAVIADPTFPMQKGGISLLMTSANIGPGGKPVWLHVYCVPTGRMEGDKQNTNPITRDDIGPGATINNSPFFLELFDNSSGKLRRLNSIRFIECGMVNQLEVRWLHPRTHRGPVVLLRFGTGDCGGWKTFPFAHGLGSKPFVQDFSFASNSEEGNMVRFDSIDRRGMMEVVEEYSDSKGQTTGRHRWNGRKFR